MNGCCALHALTPAPAPIFRCGEFTSRAGRTLPFKIDCDALKDEDWACLAEIVSRRISFGQVEGVPTGGLKFAEALRKYVLPCFDALLIVDDVLTTGGSMERQRAGRHAQGVVAFARSNPAPWITPIFWLGRVWT